MIDLLTRSATAMFGRPVERRTFLKRMAVAGSALAVAPIDYTLRPLTAESIIRCRNCARGLCCDGWTTFCCTINKGKNACPQNTYMGGWWKCTNYRGKQACAAEGVRYYIDCNRTPGTSCPGGCHCARNHCGNRSTCCNVFRYGQCNTEIPGVTEVVCRVIKCVNPCQLYVNCNCTRLIENRVCSHEANCL
jgi:hypothetical protein